MGLNMEAIQVEISKLSLEPGDVVVIRVDHELEDSEMSYLNKMMTEIFPSNRGVVLGKGASLEVVKQENPDASD